VVTVVVVLIVEFDVAELVEQIELVELMLNIRHCMYTPAVSFFNFLTKGDPLGAGVEESYRCFGLHGARAP
jgi:hypothetical protein